MNISSPLRSLELIGTDSNTTLKANRIEMLGRGTKEYMLSIREDILTNRSFKVPEDWDTDWNINLGPIWTPAELGSTALVSWLSPEYLHPSSADADICAQADDRSGNEVTWVNTYSSASSPTFTPELNGFKGMEFVDTQYLYSLDEDGGDELDPGTGDFAITFLVEFGLVSTAEKYVLCSDPTKDFALSVKQNGLGDDEYKVYFDNSSTVAALDVDQSQPIIMTVGRSGGDQFMRHANISVNDTTITGAKTADINNSQQFFIGAKESFIVNNDREGLDGFTGDIYEITFYNGTLSDDDRKSIEGYLAHKYAITGFLYGDHPYKVNPPRAGVPA